MTNLKLFRRQVVIIGKVIYAGSERAVQGATVQVSGPVVARTRTTADGLFYLVDLPNGRYTVEASIPGAAGRYVVGKRDVEVSRDKSGQVQIARVEIALSGTTVSGKVSVKGREGGLTLAEVRIKGSGERVFSNVEGDYVLTGIEPGNRTVEVYAPGYESSSSRVELKQAGSMKTVNFSLVPVKIKAAVGEPLPAAKK
jgi:Carboxypeptidase regulatory-like domain